MKEIIQNTKYLYDIITTNYDINYVCIKNLILEFY